MNKLLLLLLFLVSISGYSQNEGNIWYFGKYAGLDFNSGFPTALTDGQISSHGGSSCISDANGNLLFYSNGMSVWDKNHNIMPNGSGLMGHASATQSSIVVPKPGSSNIYYLFTNDVYNSSNGLRYSEIDMNLNGGLGDVTTTKNELLISPTTEKITAVKHNNGTDYWVISHERNTNVFYSFKISSAGITTIVTSAVGINHTGINTYSDVSIGQMKASPDGTKLAVATSAFGNTFELFDLNSTTGEISNPITLQSSTYTYPYGIEFSPDGTKFYIGTYDGNNKIYQLDLQAGSASNILNTSTLVGESYSGNIGALQIGPNSKIYVARMNSYYLGVINNPNVLGTACNYVDDGIFLSSGKSRKGLPNFIQSFFNYPRFTFENICFGDSTFFFISDVSGVLSVLWNFDDPASGSANSSALFSPYHIFSSPGQYSVTLIRNFDNSSDTVFQLISILPAPVVDIGNDTLLCPGEDITFELTDNYETIVWDNGTGSSSYFTANAGTYWVMVSDSNNCFATDSISVDFMPIPTVELGDDTIICETETIVINAQNPGFEYIWSNGANTQSISVQNADTYFVTVSNRCGVAVDSIKLEVIPSFSLDLGENQTICSGDNVELNAGFVENASYLWSSGEINFSITANTTGMYSVTVEDVCLSLSDSVLVNVIEMVSVDLRNDTGICYGSSAMLFANSENATGIYWSTGDTSQSISVNTNGTYTVIGMNDCFEASDTFNLTVYGLPNIDLGADISIFDDESVILNENGLPNLSYVWNPASGLDDPYASSPVANPSETTTYTVLATDSFGCEKSEQITITVNERPLPEIEIYNTFTPNGDGKNDTWFIENIEAYENCSLEIYNRNGNEIYKAINYKNDWDGKYKNKDCPAATYIFILDLGVTGYEIIKGTITIIR